MDCKKVGSLIFQLRKEKGMTQKQLADRMNISDKTISKWERGQGCPDISLLPELAEILDINISDILSGEIISNDLIIGNIYKMKFYMCSRCHNLMTAMGDAQIFCCGKRVQPLIPESANAEHNLSIEIIEDELFITTKHDMTKDHYISFVAYVRGDRVYIVKQYPEWNMEFRFQKQGYGRLYFYCVKHGLFYHTI